MKGKFKPVTNCRVEKHASVDKYGESVAGPTVPMMCDIVRLEWQSSKTLFSRVHSGTAGSARENTAVTVLLFAPDSGIDIGDVVTFPALPGIAVRIDERHPRFDVRGALHHIEVKGMAA